LGREAFDDNRLGLDVEAAFLGEFIDWSKDVESLLDGSEENISVFSMRPNPSDHKGKPSEKKKAERS
jgi:hypothetical protein